jgi:undecaprenyl diphosphate synthase
MNSYKELIKPEPVPGHVGIIMDGNGRWAKDKGLPRKEGHKMGAEVIEPLMDCAISLGIKKVSLYAFSVENWSRPVTEIRGLWELLEAFFKKKIDIINDKNIKIEHSGSLKKLPPSTKKSIADSVKKTSSNNGIILNFCINYGGRQEIIDSVNSWLESRKGNEKITEKKLNSFLYSRNMPDLDLLIRTSGEYRISNFMLWQIAYSELFFTDVLWPDFGAEEFYKAIFEFQNRERRYGGL